ncbi:hypothetical protein BJX70DRAFT_384221 [Aspergillus crustosus]
MPALTLHLLRLTPTTPPKTFLTTLRKTSPCKIIVASQPQRVIISPTLLDTETLLSEPWDLLLLLQQQPNPNPKEPVFPSALTPYIQKEYKIHVGIPSKLLSSYPERNAGLNSEAKDAPLTGSLENLSHEEESGQNLEVSAELVKFMEGFERRYRGPVTMLNLLHFHHPGGKESYYQYGRAFTPVAAKRGGNAKLVGNVIRPSSSSSDSDSRGTTNKPNEEDWWNEISIVHYPSLRHFCDMLAGEDYQDVNRRYRLGALRDTFLLCTTEFDLDEGGGTEKGAKL